MLFAVPPVPVSVLPVPAVALVPAIALVPAATPVPAAVAVPAAPMPALLPPPSSEEQATKLELANSTVHIVRVMTSLLDGAGVRC
jgi:hypothetical protein